MAVFAIVIAVVVASVIVITRNNFSPMHNCSPFGSIIQKTTEGSMNGHARSDSASDEPEAPCQTTGDKWYANFMERLPTQSPQFSRKYRAAYPEGSVRKFCAAYPEGSVRKYQEKLRAYHQEKQRAYNRKWYGKNLEKRRECNRKWCAKNREKLRAYQRKWCAANPAKVKEYQQKRYAKNRDYHRKYREKKRALFGLTTMRGRTC